MRSKISKKSEYFGCQNLNELNDSGPEILTEYRVNTYHDEYEVNSHLIDSDLTSSFIPGRPNWLMKF